MVDSKSGPLTEQVLFEIKKIAVSSKPVQYLLNTSADADHVGGNEAIGKVLGSANTWTIINTPGGSQTAVKILAHDNVASRMSHLPAAATPSETFVGREKEFYFNGEPVFMYHVPSAHTDGDSIVFFRQLRCRRDRRHLPDRQLPGHRPAERRQRAGRHRRTESRARPCRPCTSRGRRHVRRSRPRTHLRRVRRARVPRHGHDRPRPGSGDDREEDDARAGEGCAADARLRLALRGNDRELDDRHVRRSGVPEPFPVARSTR